MRLSISARFTIKDRPEGYLGLTGEYWNYGKNEALSLSDMCSAVLYRILWYYGLWMEPEEMEIEIKKVCSYLSSLEFYRDSESNSDGHRQHSRGYRNPGRELER